MHYMGVCMSDIARGVETRVRAHTVIVLLHYGFILPTEKICIHSICSLSLSRERGTKTRCGQRPDMLVPHRTYSRSSYLFICDPSTCRVHCTAQAEKEKRIWTSLMSCFRSYRGPRGYVLACRIRAGLLHSTIFKTVFVLVLLKWHMREFLIVR